MSQMNHDIDSENPCYLMICLEGQKPETFNLEAGNSVFIGSGTNCRLVLDSSEVHQIHCMVWMDESGTLNIQDWNTNETFVNGSKLDSEMPLKSGDTVKLADYQLIPVLDKEFHKGIASEILNRNSESTVKPAAAKPAVAETSATSILPNESTAPTEANLEQIELLPLDPPVVSQSLELDSPELNSFYQDQLSSETLAETVQDTTTEEPEWPMVEPEVAAAGFSVGEAEPVVAPVEETTTGFTYDVDADLKDDFYEDPAAGESSLAAPGFNAGFAGATFSNDFASEETEDPEILKMEVEQLRFELAQKDNELSLLRESKSNVASESIDDGQTLKLVNRLEELLEELQSSDGRIQSLEELLRLSDEATQAEKDERQQLESWVDEIEHRVGQRESESEAEAVRMAERLNQAEEHASLADARFNKLLEQTNPHADANQVSAQSAELIQECRAQIEDLHAKLQHAMQENETLRTQASQVEEGEDATETVRELQEKLVKMQVETSRERAEMARRHAELERMRDQLEERLGAAKQIEKGDSKIQAMRQHLREIHEEEKSVQEEKKKATLGSRIANLLTRVR